MESVLEESVGGEWKDVLWGSEAVSRAVEEEQGCKPRGGRFYKFYTNSLFF